MREKLAPRMKKIDAPPVMMSTWVVRHYSGDSLIKTASLATEQSAFACADHWRQSGEDHYAEVEVIRQERKLR